MVTVVPATLARLMREGLERHDAIHAVGSVLLGIFKKPGKNVDINAEYGRELVELTGIPSERAQDLIMKARAHWFESAENAEGATNAPQGH